MIGEGFIMIQNPIGFAIWSAQRNAKEEQAIIPYCDRNGIPYKICNRESDRPEGYIPCGTVEWCEKFLTPEQSTPDYYPEFLKDYLFRKVWRADKWPLGQRVFIKPSDKHKRFIGRITDGSYRKKKRGPYWCSEVVNFVEEWRYYIADGKVLIGEWYFGDEMTQPKAPELNVSIPDGYCGALDFGRLKTGELALIEANSPYACGWYGTDHDKYVEWIIKGWAYMTRGVQ